MDLIRSDLATQAADAIRTMIVDGDLPAGGKINQAALADRLRISRTPLREALNRLVAEGAVRNDCNVGYFVAPMSVAEFDSLYAMRPILDPAALRAGGLPGAKRLERLRKLNARLAATSDPLKAIDLDDRWHAELIAGCPNPILLDLIARFTSSTRRYEIALLRERPQVEAAAQDHEAVMDALERGDLEGGCEALRLNLERGAAPLRAWLEERSA